MQVVHCLLKEKLQSIKLNTFNYKKNLIQIIKLKNWNMITLKKKNDLLNKYFFYLINEIFSKGIWFKFFIYTFSNVIILVITYYIGNKKKIKKVHRIKITLWDYTLNKYLMWHFLNLNFRMWFKLIYLFIVHNVV